MGFTCDDKGEIRRMGWRQNYLLILLSVLPDCVRRVPLLLSYMLVPGVGRRWVQKIGWSGGYFSVSVSNLANPLVIKSALSIFSLPGLERNVNRDTEA